MSKSLGLTISRVNDARDVVQYYVTIASPFLDGKVLDVNMSNSWCRAPLIHDGDSGLLSSYNGVGSI